MTGRKPVPPKPRPAVSTAAAVLTAAVLLAACGTPPPRPLYSWGDFPQQQYQALRSHGTAPAEQMQAMEAHMQKAADAHQALPPGFRSHLGMLKLSAGQPDQARALWQEEKAAFPESAPYMAQLLKRLDPPAAATERPE